MIKNYGFKIEDVVIKPEDYQFGSNLPLEVLVEDGQWDKWLPVYEPQAEKYETFGCTIWGSQNQVETMLKFLYGIEYNFSERLNYIDAGVTLGGGNPKNAYVSMQNTGTVAQEILPIPDTYAEFITPKPLTEVLKEEAKKFIAQYDLRYEWVTPSDPSKMKQLIKSTLRYSPVALSVTAWTKDKDGLYIDNGMPNTHWVVCFGWRETKQGLILRVFDSYDQSIKELHPDHFVAVAMRIWIGKRTPEQKKTWWVTDIIKNLLQALQDLLITDIILINTPKPMENTPIPPIETPKTAPGRTLSEVAKGYINKDASPANKADSSVSCVESACTIIQELVPDFPNLLSTIELNKELKKRIKQFTPTLTPEPNCIIIAVTEGKKTGHAGFVIENNRIISNDSLTGLMKNNYSVPNFVNYFTSKGRELKIEIYKLK